MNTAQNICKKGPFLTIFGQTKGQKGSFWRPCWSLKPGPPMDVALFYEHPRLFWLLRTPLAPLPSRAVSGSQGVRLRHGPHVTNWDIEECVSLSKRYEIWCLKQVKTHPRQCYRVKNYFFKLNLWENAGQNPPQGWALYMVVFPCIFFLRKLFSWDPRISSSKTAVFLICYVRAIFWSGKVIFWSKVDEK